jgi:mannose-1-phosphate guanylyltransferase / mannose-6-phosphate isomerase
MSAASASSVPARPGAVVPVLLSGGSGSRLWPLSRAGWPKQFWPLVSARSMIAETGARALGDGFAPPMVVCNRDHRFLVAEELRLLGGAAPAIVLEPVGRNSAPAIAAAALLVAARDPDAVLWMMAADAAITDVPALHRALAAAVAAARQGRIVTFGMRPTAPETGYGYIEQAAALPGLAGVHAVARFIEKPDAATAATFVASGRHLWNSGMFVFTARTLLAEMEKYAPAVVAAVGAAVAARVEDGDFIHLDPKAFAGAPDISLDYAVAERTGVAAVVPASLGWSDVGSWRALWEMGGKDAAGNVVAGDVLLEGASDCYVRGDGILTAVVGLKDAVVVSTPDAVLALHRDRAQDVKKVVDRLRALGRGEAVAHRLSRHPWGLAETLFGDGDWRLDRLALAPGGERPAQRTNRAACWLVAAGSVLASRDGATVRLNPGDKLDLPAGSVCGLCNDGSIPVTVVELQRGPRRDEEGTVRLDGGD